MFVDRMFLRAAIAVLVVIAIPALTFAQATARLSVNRTCPGKEDTFELRYYIIKPGALPETAKRWEQSLPARTKLSAVLLAGGVELGSANGFVHIWPYASLDERARVRAEALRTKVWPPPGGGGQLLTQDNKILVPAVFSPLQ